MNNSIDRITNMCIMWDGTNQNLVNSHVKLVYEYVKGDLSPLIWYE